MKARMILAGLAVTLAGLLGAQEKPEESASNPSSSAGESRTAPQAQSPVPAGPAAGGGRDMVSTADGPKPISELPEKQQVNVWMARAAAAYNAENTRKWVDAVQALHELRPYNQDFMRQLVQGYAQLDQKSRAYNIMLAMQQQGLAYDWDEDPKVENLRGTQLYDYLSRLMREAGEPFGKGEVITRLADTIVMPETLAHDPESGRFFLGTVRDGLILVHQGVPGEDAEWETFVDSRQVEGLDAVMAVAVDAERGHLWAASGMLGQYRDYSAGKFGRTALVRFDLATGEKLSVHPVTDEGDHILGSLAVASDGTVYAADTLASSVYRLAPDAEHPEAFMGHPDFSSLRGIALSDDDRLLYVADYERGIYVADLSQEQAYTLAVPDSLNVGGIDDLHWWDGHLVMIQNGIAPQRVVRLQLGEDGLGVTNVFPVEAAHPEFDTPTYGTLVDNQLYYLAANHWDDVSARGEVPEDLPSTPIVRTRVDADWSQEVGGDVVERLRELSGQSDEDRPSPLKNPATGDDNGGN